MENTQGYGYSHKTFNEKIISSQVGHITKIVATLNVLAWNIGIDFHKLQKYNEVDYTSLKCEFYCKFFKSGRQSLNKV